jgi:hypothetical protein
MRFTHTKLRAHVLAALQESRQPASGLKLPALTAGRRQWQLPPSITEQGHPEEAAEKDDADEDVLHGAPPFSPVRDPTMPDRLMFQEKPLCTQANAPPSIFPLPANDSPAASGTPEAVSGPTAGADDTGHWGFVERAYRFAYPRIQRQPLFCRAFFRHLFSLLPRLRKTNGNCLFSAGHLFAAPALERPALPLVHRLFDLRGCSLRVFASHRLFLSDSSPRSTRNCAEPRWFPPRLKASSSIPGPAATYFLWRGRNEGNQTRAISRR